MKDWEEREKIDMMTSTGYVRRDAKRAMHLVSPSYIKGLVPNYDLYCLLREAFRGGNTHANMYYAGHILTDVKSADRSDSFRICRDQRGSGVRVYVDEEGKFVGFNNEEVSKFVDHFPNDEKQNRKKTKLKKAR